MESPDHRNAFTAVVLAAGISARMGSNKLLLEIAGRPLIRHIVGVVHGVIDDVTVVVGHQAERVMEALGPAHVRFVRVDPRDGQAASIRAGLRAVPPGKPVLVAVADQPLLTMREIEQLCEAFRQTDGTRALVPSLNGQRGWPMILPVKARQDFDWSADNLPSGQALPFPTRNPVFVETVETPEDWHRLFNPA